MTELLTQLAEFIDRYGFPLIALLAIAYAFYKWLIPAFLTQMDRQQKYLFEEIGRLNKVAEERDEKMLEAFKQNTTAFQELRLTMEHMQRDLNTVKDDISKVYRIVGAKRGLLDDEEK